MAFYIELTLLPQEDAPTYFLWSKLYQQLHLALAEIKNADDKVSIGVSFPQYQFNPEKKIGFLGTKLRLFSQTENELDQLNIKKWLERLTDYVHITSIRPVPEEKITGYACFKRKQPKTNAERLARHRVKRGDIDFDEALSRYQNVVTTSDLPFIQLKSLTSAQPFKLFIEKQPAEQSASQVFSTYGLSSESSVPEF
ncbi:type I-F CRISPR-associated endoribonuclease Cas6/Csy4 [Alkanindiges sp. WGS2144]|uniref:type I-F CRISPR-associated endoribonuclease Cas6/Csy4 n=1 Tax=Alkanindiges sp. WGS2144 TaxID=3366808 RepID=UPI00375247E7